MGLRLVATRLNLPGWYGPGSGRAAIADVDGIEALRRAYDRAAVRRAARQRRDEPGQDGRLIGARYLALGGRDDLTQRVLAQDDLTRRLVLAVTGRDRLLADREVLSRAVALRDPYVDALSYLQLRALAALREEEPRPGTRPRRTLDGCCCSA